VSLSLISALPKSGIREAGQKLKPTLACIMVEALRWIGRGRAAQGWPVGCSTQKQLAIDHSR